MKYCSILHGRVNLMKLPASSGLTFINSRGALTLPESLSADDKGWELPGLMLGTGSSPIPEDILFLTSTLNHTEIKSSTYQILIVFVDNEYWGGSRFYGNAY